MVNPTISIVLMSYNNVSTVELAASSLLEQDTRHPFEIVLVSSGTDGSAAYIRELFPQIMTIERRARLFPGQARNLGIRAARGEIVAFLAADCIAKPGWIETRARAHQAGHSVVAGPLTNGAPRSAHRWASHYSLFPSRLPGRPAGYVAFPDAAAHSLSYRREILQLVGPFPENVRVAEDTEMARRLDERGIPIWFQPSVLTAHLSPGGPLKAVAEQWQRGARRASSEGLRLRTESNLTAIAALMKRTAERTSWVTREAWRWERARWRVALLLPLIASFVATNQVGWFMRQLRLRRSDALRSTENVRALPVRDADLTIQGSSPESPESAFERLEALPAANIDE